MAGLLSSAAGINPGGQSGTPTVVNPVAGGGSRQDSGPSSGGANPVPLNSLYAQPTTAGTFAASTGTAAQVGPAAVGNASQVGPQAGITGGMINPNDSTNAASQIDAITNANSPYIQQATQQGFLSAANRGLANSSLAAGASEASAIQAAAPLALQNAQVASGGQMQNSQLETQANEFNASQSNANAQLNAQLATQQEQFNKSQQQAAAATNTAAQNAMTQQTQQLNEQINQQYLSGSQSQTLASIQGQYNQLIQQNASAAGMYTSMLNNIGATMANKDIAPQRVADTISAMQNLLSGGLSVIDAINGGGVGGGFGGNTYTPPGGAPPVRTPINRPGPPK